MIHLKVSPALLPRAWSGHARSQVSPAIYWARRQHGCLMEVIRLLRHCSSSSNDQTYETVILRYMMVIIDGGCKKML